MFSNSNGKKLKINIFVLFCGHVYFFATLFLTCYGFSRVHSTQSFARSMYCRDLDFVSVCRDFANLSLYQTGVISEL
jgi:hypothetical protein